MDGASDSLVFISGDPADVATQEKMRITSGGNVGIGTSTPQAALTVVKDLSGGGDATGFRLNAVSGATSNTLFGGPVSSGNYSFFQAYKEGTSAGVRSLNLNPIGGNVGIGVTGPAYKLHVNSGTTNNVAIFESSDGGGVITVKDSAGEVAFSNIGNNIYFKTSSSQSNKMAILNSGAIQFNAYGAGTLVTDASGNITASSGGGAGGPFLPLAGGTMSGGIVFSSQDGAACTPVNWLSYLCPDSSGTTVNAKIGEGVVIFPDSSKVTFGDGQDLEIYHDGGNSYIKSNTGWLNMPTSGSGISMANSDFSKSIARFLVDAQVELYYNGTKRFETTSTGVKVTGDLIVTENVGIGVTNPDVPLSVSINEDGSGIGKGAAKFINTNTGQGATTMHMVQTSSGSFANAVKFWQGGTPTAVGFIRLTTSATQFITSASDLNLKKNITNWSDNTLSKFKALEPKKFRFKTQDASEDKTLGFIAQNEVDNFPEAYPQFLGEDEKPYYGFNPSGMVPHLMKAIKDLVEKVEILENKITQLEN
jgi:hypothetical protein